MAKRTRKESGPRPRGGRPKGSKGKATIERELKAAQQIDKARREGRELAVTVLENLMNIALGATGLNRPTPQADLLTGRAANPDGDWDRFGAWFDRTAFCAKELAKYQSPQIRAVDIPTAPPDIGNQQDEDFTIDVFDNGRKVLEYKPRDAA